MVNDTTRLLGLDGLLAVDRVDVDEDGRAVVDLATANDPTWVI
jgi:hypothetical protein